MYSDNFQVSVGFLDPGYPDRKKIGASEIFGSDPSGYPGGFPRIRQP